MTPADIHLEQRDPESSSFRDPSGFLFTSGGVLYRQVNQSYRPDYDRLMESGLYERLVEQGFRLAEPPGQHGIGLRAAEPAPDFGTVVLGDVVSGRFVAIHDSTSRNRHGWRDAMRRERARTGSGERSP